MGKSMTMSSLSAVRGVLDGSPTHSRGRSVEDPLAYTRGRSLDDPLTYNHTRGRSLDNSLTYTRGRSLDASQGKDANITTNLFCFCQLKFGDKIKAFIFLIDFVFMHAFQRQ